MSLEDHLKNCKERLRNHIKKEKGIINQMNKIVDIFRGHYGDFISLIDYFWKVLGLNIQNTLNFKYCLLYEEM